MGEESKALTWLAETIVLEAKPKFERWDHLFDDVVQLCGPGSLGAIDDETFLQIQRRASRVRRAITEVELFISQREARNRS